MINISSSVLYTLSDSNCGYIINNSFGGSGSKGYLKTNNTNWEVLASFIFTGTEDTGTPTTFQIISWSKDGTTSFVRLFDYNNNNEIAEITVGSSTRQILLDATLSNLPIGKSIFEIQGKVTKDKKELYIESIMLKI